MSIEIRQVRTEDELRQALAVRVSVFVEEQGVSPEEELDEYDASPESCRHFLALQEDQAVGASRWRMYDEVTAKLQRIAVLADCRGLRIGQQLIAAMEADICRTGVRAVILDGQVHAEGFYRKLGYEVISDEPFLDAGIWHVRMRRELQPEQRQP